ncbi:PAS domain S-box protein [Candidatus Azambacteria bacterium]|nr:PAS domain S-box protein [Candidatus Azambacteria bacterium]
MKEHPSAPLSAAQREIERVKIVYEEDAMARRVRAQAEERLHEKRIEDQSLRLKSKMEELRDGEIATLNILEDTRELELTLESERDRLSHIIASMNEGLVFIDNAYRIILANPVAANMLEIAVEKAPGINLIDITTLWKGNKKLSTEERFSTKALTTGKPVFASLADDIFIETQSGRKFPVAFMISPLTEKNDATEAVIVFRDITEEKNLAEAQKSFASVASHQLRTPLTAVQWNLELLMGKEVGTLTDKQKQFALDAYEGAEKLVETINLLLSLTRVESGFVQIDPSPIAIPDFMRAIADELAPLAAQKELTLTMREPQDPIPHIMLDAPMLREVAVNILSNAIRYSNPGGAVEVAFETSDSAVTISVKDNGIGIPAAQHSRIFEKFFRADNAIRKTADGTGLGLNLAKALVTLWHGTLWFASEEGKGTTFYFTIPYEGIKEKREGKSLVM